METTASKPSNPTTDRRSDSPTYQRPIRIRERRCRSFAGIWSGAASLLQFTFGIDCMIALLIGLFGGMLAGMTLTRMRLSDEPTEPSKPSTQPSRTAPRSISPTELVDGEGRSFDDGPALTDEERVVRLLASNDGRMKQSQIVDETDWSKAKVSRLLSAMEENEEITKLTVGRENIIFLGSTEGAYASTLGSKD